MQDQCMTQRLATDLAAAAVERLAGDGRVQDLELDVADRFVAQRALARAPLETLPKCTLGQTRQKYSQSRGAAAHSQADSPSWQFTLARKSSSAWRLARPGTGAPHGGWPPQGRVHPNAVYTHIMQPSTSARTCRWSSAAAGVTTSSESDWREGMHRPAPARSSPVRRPAAPCPPPTAECHPAARWGPGVMPKKISI